MQFYISKRSRPEVVSAAFSGRSMIGAAAPRFVCTTISLYGWMAAVGYIMASLLFRPSVDFVPALESQSTESPLLFPDPPAFIAHLSDLHFSRADHRHTAKMERLFQSLTTRVRPVATIITGDLTNGGYFPVHGQFAENWQPFVKLRNEFPGLLIVAAAGNRDELHVDAIESDHHFYNRFLNDGNVSTFISRSYLIDVGVGRVKVVVFNPFTFPTPPLPLRLFAHPTSEMFGRIDSELRRDKDIMFSIVACHYPLEAMVRAREMKEILSRNHVRYYLAGHLHRKDTFHYHRFSNSLEVIAGAPGARTLTGLIAVDNGVVTCSVVNFRSDYVFVLTYPPPQDQFNIGDVFIGKIFRVRLIIFDRHPKTLHISLDGVELGSLSVDSEAENYVIFGFPIETEVGSHELTIDGDVAIKRVFVVGRKCPSSKEVGPARYLRWAPILFCIVVTHSLVLSILVAPPLLNRALQSPLAVFGDWLFRRWTPARSFFPLNLLAAFFIGPLFFAWRFHFAAPRVKRLVRCLYATILACPFYFIKGTGGINVVWSGGFAASRAATWDICSMSWSTGLIAVIVIPLHSIAGLATQARGWSVKLAIQFVVWTVPVFIAVAATFVLIYIGGAAFAVLTSPVLYVNVPIIACTLSFIVADVSKRASPEKEQ